jgi:lysophospholipase L1-like esterase
MCAENIHPAQGVAMNRRTFEIGAGLIALGLLFSSPAAAQSVPLVGLGDSIGEGVQSGDASHAAQGYSFVNLIGWRMGADLALPLIRTNWFGAVGSTDGRSRISTTSRSRNLAVSGADAQSILRDAATALTVAEIDTETELVLFPETGSQIEIAERLRPAVVACWIGNNDALGAALAYDQLNATQLTPVPEFTANFTELVQRLDALGARTVFGTIPDITGIGFLLNRQDLIRFVGSDHGLPDGHLTSVPAMFYVRLGLESPAIFTDPNFVLDPSEQATISGHIAALNNVIRTTAATYGMAVADTHAIFQILSLGPFEFFGSTLTTRFLGGLFSLDGVHPSNTGQALAAYFFIEALNQHYGLGIPQIDGPTFQWLVQTDPHIDRDGDGRVKGRFGEGLLETMMSFLSISGDSNEGVAAALSADAPAAASRTPSADGSQSVSVLDEYARQTGRDLRTMSRQERAQAVRSLFGIARRR